MRLSKSQAALFNKRELRLLTAKGPWHVSDLATAIRQVRDLRDRQRDLLQRQDARLARAGTGRVGAIGVANERTALKERILDEALDGLQAELRDIDQESTLACRELLDDVPGQRANPKKAAKRASTAGASGAARKTTPAGAGHVAKKTAAASGKRAGKVAKKSTARRATA